MNVTEIFEWAIMRMKVIKSDPDKIEKVRIYNDLYNHKGTGYFRINFEVTTNIDRFSLISYDKIFKLTKEQEDNKWLWEYFNGSSYIYFDRRFYDDSYVEANYEWIIAIFNDKFLLAERKFECIIESYLSEKHREHAGEKQKSENERIKYFETYIPIAEPKDIVLLTSWRGEKLIEIERNNVDVERPYSGYEIKMDLSKGKILFDSIWETDILIVLTKSQLRDILELKPYLSNKKKLIEELKSNYKKLKLKYIQD